MFFAHFIPLKYFAIQEYFYIQTLYINKLKIYPQLIESSLSSSDNPENTNKNASKVQNSNFTVPPRTHLPGIKSRRIEATERIGSTANFSFHQFSRSGSRGENMAARSVQQDLSTLDRNHNFQLSWNRVEKERGREVSPSASITSFVTPSPTSSSPLPPLRIPF